MVRGAAQTSCPSVQVSEDVIVDLTGDDLLLQHSLDRLTCCQCLDLVPLLRLLLLTKHTPHGVTDQVGGASGEALD